MLTPGGAGIENMQQEFGTGLKAADYSFCAGAADCMRKHCEPCIGARNGTQVGDVDPHGPGSATVAIDPSVLTESIVLSCLGGIAGLAVAYGGSRLLLAMAFPDAHNLPIDASPSPVVLAFAFGLSLLTGLIFGVAPAWVTSHSQPAEALRGSNRRRTIVRAGCSGRW